MPYNETEQAANVAKVRGTLVTLRRYIGQPKTKTAKIKGYVSPCVWELDREIGSPKSRFHADRDVCLPDGKPVGSLIPSAPR